MHEKSIQTLEYPKIIDRLLFYCAFSVSRDMASELLPSDDFSIVQHRLNLTTEARRLLDIRSDFGVKAARDIRPAVQLAQREGTLQPQQLLDIQNTMRSAAYVGRFISRLEPEEFPNMRHLAADMPVRQKLDDRIEAVISDEGQVRDSASPALQQIRAQIRIARQRLQDRLGTLVNEFRSALQEQLITMREGRYVLPVRAEARSQVRGIVHDQSSSGATVFIEPLVIVEMNNRLRELEMDEQREVDRILRELTAFVASEAPYCLLAVDLLGQVDLQLAKAQYSAAIKGTAAQLSDSGTIRLFNARHPLLTGKVVPMNFSLGERYQMVVITGPNTGGKTVSLKTVGLLALMTAAGLHIPAEDRSVMPVYRNIFADIGDEQSIEQSLSTFSSHMTRIIDIMHQAGENTLVLLDELGAGTDPAEGSALARAILLTLLEKKAACVATTHYSELKAFAHEQAGVINASVEFNVDTLSPTYQLQIGIPGRSNALAIASRLGLDATIIDRARSLSDVSNATMEQLLAEIQEERNTAREERYHLSLERAAVDMERQKLAERVTELELQRGEIERDRVRALNEARAEARKQLQQLKSDIGRLRAESQRSQLTEERLNELRSRFRSLEDRSEDLPEPAVPKALRGARRKTPAQSAVEEETTEKVIPGDPVVGDTVRIITIGQIGELLTLPDSKGDAEVQIGALKIRVNARDLERLSRRQARAQERTSQLTQLIERSAPASQLDLRGMRVEEVFETVDRYLNDAYLAGLSTVRIVHGKGTGALRQAVREQLQRHALVRSFATPSPQEGGDGVTQIVLAH